MTSDEQDQKKSAFIGAEKALVEARRKTQKASDAPMTEEDREWLRVRLDGLERYYRLANNKSGSSVSVLAEKLASLESNLKRIDEEAWGALAVHGNFPHDIAGYMWWIGEDEGNGNLLNLLQDEAAAVRKYFENSPKSRGPRGVKTTIIQILAYFYKTLVGKPPPASATQSPFTDFVDDALSYIGVDSIDEVSLETIKSAVQEWKKGRSR